MIYKAIKYILENNSAFATAIGTDNDGDIKVYPIHPRKKVALPFCVFNITDQRGNPTKDTVSSLDEGRIRVAIFDTELDDVIDLADKVRDALDKQIGTFNGVTIASIDLESLNDDFVEDYGDRGAISIEMNFTIWLEP